MRKKMLFLLILCLLLGGNPRSSSASSFLKPNGVSMSKERFVADYTGEKSPKVSCFNGRDGVQNETIVLCWSSNRTFL